MKKLPILQYAIRTRPEDTADATTVELIRMVLAQPPTPSPQNPNGGFDFLEVRARNRIADALDKLTTEAKEIKFEDADFAVVVQCVRAFRGWNFTKNSGPNIEKFVSQFGL